MMRSSSSLVPTMDLGRLHSVGSFRGPCYLFAWGQVFGLNEGGSDPGMFPKNGWEEKM